MKFEIFLLSLFLAAAKSQGPGLNSGVSECEGHYRRPELSDISVTCGTSSIDLAVQICPAMYTGYNASLLILNHRMETTCRGILDLTVDPPVARFSFPLTTTDACSSIFTTTSAPGTGIFSDFSNIQTVNISGVIRSIDLTTGTVTYNAEIKYFYSCAYPLEYLINNTQVDVSASSIAIKDRNGSFISTLSLKLFQDSEYTTPLFIPPQGVELRSRVHVEVRATNLTGQYHVLLDRCYASISPLPSNSTFFNLFVPCNQDSFTTMVLNGVGQIARFHFPAFRFVEQHDEMVSTYYLHCITRLCEISTCSSFMECDGRKRRDAGDDPTGNDNTITSTVTSQKIITEAVQSTEGEMAASQRSDSSSVGLAAAVGVLAFACVAALCVAVAFYNKQKY
ncbi:unnamed protein product [Merluccius merluccius]